MNVSPIELALTPALYDKRGLKDNHYSVAVDILRATTAICAAFSSGVEEIVPLDSLEALEEYRALGYLRAAERGGHKIGDAEYGNSPTEYCRTDLRGKRMAYSTTNGTRCILRGSDAQVTFVGAFANIDTVAQRLIDDPHPTVIICSGWQGDFSIEDTLFAGALITTLIDSGRYSTSQDAALMAVDLWKLGKDNPYDFCQKRASHIQRLESFGAHDDICFSFQPNTCNVLPTLENGKLHL